MTVVTRGRVLAVPALLMALTLGACDVLGPGTDDTLREQLRVSEQRWQEHGPASYEMVMQIGRLVGEGAPPVNVSVTAGQITSLVVVESGEPYIGTGTLPYRPVEGLFDMIRDALNQRVPGIHVRYQPDFGVPLEIQIDYDRRRSDDDIIVNISEFTPAA